MFKNLKIISKNALTSKRQRKTSHFFDMLCKIIISNRLSKIRNGQARSRKLWPIVRYADTLQTTRVDDPKKEKVNGLKELNVDGPMIETARI